MKLSASDQIQIISLALEFTGLTLTITETFYPKGNTILEQWFKLKIDRVNQIWYKYNDTLAKTLMIASLLGIISYFYSLADADFWLRYGGYLSFYYILLIGFFQFTIIFNVLRRLLPNRQLLALGITLTAVGIFGEIIQIVQIFES